MPDANVEASLYASPRIRAHAFCELTEIPVARRPPCGTLSTAGLPSAGSLEARAVGRPRGQLLVHHVHAAHQILQVEEAPPHRSRRSAGRSHDDHGLPAADVAPGSAAVKTGPLIGDAHLGPGLLPFLLPR